MKSYVLPILLGTLTGVLALWGFEKFGSQDRAFFEQAFIKSAIVAAVVTVIMNLMRKKRS